MTREQNEPATEKPKNKGGRPRKHPESARRPTLAFRVRGDTYDRLKASAEASERSISEEIEDIITRNFERAEQVKTAADNVGEMVRQAVKLAEISSGAQFYESTKGYVATVHAIQGLIALMRRPDGYTPSSAPGLGLLGSSLGGLNPAPAATEEQLEFQRGQLIGWAAASQAVNWHKGQDEKGEPYQALISGGRLYEDSYDRRALLDGTSAEQPEPTGNKQHK